MIRKFTAIACAPVATLAAGAAAFARPEDFQHRMTPQAKFGETDA